LAHLDLAHAPDFGVELFLERFLEIGQSLAQSDERDVVVHPPELAEFLDRGLGLGEIGLAFEKMGPHGIGQRGQRRQMDLDLVLGRLPDPPQDGEDLQPAPLQLRVHHDPVEHGRIPWQQLQEILHALIGEAHFDQAYPLPVHRLGPLGAVAQGIPIQAHGPVAFPLDLQGPRLEKHEIATLQGGVAQPRRLLPIIGGLGPVPGLHGGQPLEGFGLIPPGIAQQGLGDGRFVGLGVAGAQGGQGIPDVLPVPGADEA